MLVSTGCQISWEKVVELGFELVNQFSKENALPGHVYLYGESRRVLRSGEDILPNCYFDGDGYPSVPHFIPVAEFHNGWSGFSEDSADHFEWVSRTSGARLVVTKADNGWTLEYFPPQNGYSFYAVLWEKYSDENWRSLLVLPEDGNFDEKDAQRLRHQKSSGGGNPWVQNWDSDPRTPSLAEEWVDNTGPISDDLAKLL